MAPNIFMTGATGYVGGTIFNTLVTTHPEYNITVLLRNPKPSFSEKYPSVKVLKGAFEDSDLLRDAASKADIVVHHGDSDNEAAVSALLEGVKSRAAASKPAFYIHLSGTATVAQWENLGELHPKVWSDIDDIDAIWSVPDSTVHRNTERLIQEAWASEGLRVKTAVVCPPIIHGKGTGPGRALSDFYPSFLSGSIKKGATFYLGAGTNIYSRVHVEDLAQVFLKLIESAAVGGEGAEWGREGYYFTTSEEISQKEIAVAAGKILKKKGLVATEEPKQVELEELDSIFAHIPFPGVGRLLIAVNSRSNPDRARKVLSYEPRGLSFLDSLEDDLERAAR